MNERIDLHEVNDFPPDLRDKPRMNSERWSLKTVLITLGTPILASLTGAFIGLKVGTLLYLNSYGAEGLVAFGAWLGIIAGFYSIHRRILDSA